MENSIFKGIDEKKELKSMAEMALEKAKAKDEGKIPVRVGDKLNSIIFIRKGEDKEKAIQEFLRKTAIKKQWN